MTSRDRRAGRAEGPCGADTDGEGRPGAGPRLYVAWAALSIVAAVGYAGVSAEDVTRLLVVAFLLVQVALRDRLARALPRVPPTARFIALGTLLAAVVEGLHMPSVPVFASLRIDPSTGVRDALVRYGLDLVLTVPAYLVILAVMAWFVRRYRYSTWQYVIVMGFAQAVGDGGAFYFIGAPAMLAFLPYPMTNYHAMNVVPFLAIRRELDPARPATAGAYLAVPAVILTYLVCGALIRVAGRAMGLDPAST